MSVGSSRPLAMARAKGKSALGAARCKWCGERVVTRGILTAAEKAARAAGYCKRTCREADEDG